MTALEPAGISRPRVMCDPIQLVGLADRLSQDVTLVSWDVRPSSAYHDVAGIFTYGHPLVDAELLDRLPGVRIISNFGVGYDHIDVSAARERRIRVANTPGVLDSATADLGMALLLAAARRLPQAGRYYQHWLPQTEAATVSAPRRAASPLALGSDLAGKTLGILGMGRIGRQVAQRAQGFQMKIMYHNRRPIAESIPFCAEFATLAELLRCADFLIITLPLTRDTERLVDERALAQMCPTATLINIARGSIVDTAALVDALREGRLAYAALDVTEPEPLPINHPLRELDNVFLTPHIGSATEETRRAMGKMAHQNLLLGLAGRELLSEV